MTDLCHVRAARHDVTPAIPRAIEAGRGLFDDIDILCWDRSGDDLPAVSRVQGVELRRFRRPVPPGSPLRPIFLLAYQAWVLCHLLRRRPRWVQVCDFESALPTALACLLGRGSWIYDMRDPVAESYGFSRGLRNIVYAVDWFLMSRASAFVLPLETRRAYLGRWARRRPVQVVRNTCHDDLERIEAGETTIPSDSQVVRLAYLGYLVPTRGSDMLLDLCDDPGSDVELWVAGSCRSAELRRRLETTETVHWLGLLEREAALRLMYDADAVTLLYAPAVPVNRMAAPNKFYEALMTGTPVLVSRGMSLAEDVEREGLGLVVDYGDAQSLRRAVETLRDETVRRSFRERCRAYFLEHCRLDDELVEYRRFYRRLLESSGAGGEG